jgi:hypothetical protein
MTASECLRTRAAFNRLGELACISDTMAEAWLKGLPAASPYKQRFIEAAAVEVGVDLSTIPVLSPERIDELRQKRRPKCKRCRELERKYAKLRAFAARQVQQCRDLNEEINDWQCKAEQAQSHAYPRGTVAAVDAEDARRMALVAQDPVIPHAPPSSSPMLPPLSPTPAPIPIARRPAPPKQPVVKLQGFPPEALTETG